jgi:hypothetical protein
MGVRAALKTQHHAALGMLRQTIELSPDDLWTSEAHPNRFWHVVYHALFYGHLYLVQNEKAFTPWEHHREEHQFLGKVPWPPHHEVRLGEPYAKEDLLAYLDEVDGMVDPVVADLDLDTEDCGFWWYDLPKLDHELLCIRHTQHHVGQLAERLRVEAGLGLEWRAR